MQLFPSEDAVKTWSAATGNPPGLVFQPAQLWDLARLWCDDRLDLRWKRRTPAERQTILDRVGLTGPDRAIPG